MKSLNALKRELSESNEFLREKGNVPAVIYGKGVENILVSVKENEVRSLWRDVRDTEPFQIKVEGGESYTVIMKDMQVHVVSGNIIHIDFLIQS